MAEQIWASSMSYFISKSFPYFNVCKIIVPHTRDLTNSDVEVHIEIVAQSVRHKLLVMLLSNSKHRSNLIARFINFYKRVFVNNSLSSMPHL